MGVCGGLPLGTPLGCALVTNKETKEKKGHNVCLSVYDLASEPKRFDTYF
jgi:hypothetical protein